MSSKKRHCHLHGDYWSDNGGGCLDCYRERQSRETAQREAEYRRQEEERRKDEDRMFASIGVSTSQMNEIRYALFMKRQEEGRKRVEERAVQEQQKHQKISFSEAEVRKQKRLKEQLSAQAARDQRESEIRIREQRTALDLEQSERLRQQREVETFGASKVKLEDVIVGGVVGLIFGAFVCGVFVYITESSLTELSASAWRIIIFVEAVCAVMCAAIGALSSQ